MQTIKFFLTQFLFLYFVFLSPVIAAGPVVAGIDQDRIKRLDDKLAGYIADGRYAGIAALIMRHGKTAHEFTGGWQDRERQVPMSQDTIFRIYSMSKAITSVAAMILYEEGHFQLDDPIDKFLPELKNLRVYVAGEAETMQTEPLQRPITFRDLFTHTSGFTYHFMGDSAIHKLYRLHGVMPGAETLQASASEGQAAPDLTAMISALATIPLLHQPGEQMSYGISIDVLGRLIEIMSAQPLDTFLQQSLFDPLQMVDTGFVVPENKLHRFASNYSWKGDHLELVDDPYKSRYRHSGRLLAGGAGLVSTTKDYMQFLHMLLNGGQLGTARILSPITVDFILSNHLPEENMPRPPWMKHHGHGLGFGLLLDPVGAGRLSSAGAASWSGAATTIFWLDRKENLAAVFMAQDMPLKDTPLMEYARSLTYQAIVK